MQGVSHVLHCATCKETPDDVMDVTVKGLFWLLEECRASPTFQQFILIGGDAALGHFFYQHPVPVTEQQKHTAYPGCYALSKVLEEVMLEQYFVQYDLIGVLPARTVDHGEGRFQILAFFRRGRFWRAALAGPRRIGSSPTTYHARISAVPRDARSRTACRSSATSSTSTIWLKPFCWRLTIRRRVSKLSTSAWMSRWTIGRWPTILNATRGLPRVDIKTPYRSTWLDNAKAQFLLGWRPRFDLPLLIEEAWSYKRAAGDERKVWYPG